MLSSVNKKLKGFATRNEINILVYHGVADETLPFRIWTQMNEHHFAQHMRYLSEVFRCISVRQLKQELAQGKMSRNTVVVTLDDGFATTLYRALPILEHYGVPASVFVASGFTGSGRLIWPEKLAAAVILTAEQGLVFEGTSYDLSSLEEKNDSRKALIQVLKEYHPRIIDEKVDEICNQLGVSDADIRSSDFYENMRMMNEDELVRLASSDLIEIGAHTVNHAILTQVDDKEARNEIVESKLQLERLVGEVTSFAYPHGGVGEFGRQHRKMAVEAGFEMIFTAIPGTVRAGSDPHELHRTGIGSEVGVGQLEYMLHGGISFDEAEHPAYHLMKGLITGVSH